MKKTFIALALLAAFGTASATNDNNSKPPVTNNSGGNGGVGGQGGAGGLGGNGGAGGSGTGVGIGIAGAAASAGAAVVGSGNSSVRNTNANIQGQMQGQGQSQSNRATGGNSGGNTLSGGAVSVAVEGAKGDTYIAPAQERNPVATAYAAPLTASNGTCMGSSSGGAQGASFGISLGTTWKDDDCDRRYDAAGMVALNTEEDRAAARALLQQKPSIKAAYDSVKSGKRAEAILSGTSVTTATPTATRDPQYTDPIVRARLGLPPLK